MKSAIYRPFCFLCRQRISPDQPQNYRVVVDCRDDSTDIEPQWDESLCRSELTRSGKDIFGRIVLKGNESEERIQSSQLRRLWLSDTVHLIHTSCKALLNHSRNRGLRFDTILNALIPSTPLEEMKHIKGALISDFDSTMFAITSVRSSSRLEIFLKPASQTTMCQVRKTLPEELITLVLSSTPRGLSYWIAIHLKIPGIVRNDVHRCVVKDNLEVIKTLLTLQRDETDLSDRSNTTGDWIEDVVIESYIEANFIDMGGTMYLHRLSKGDPDRYPHDGRLSWYRVALSDSQAMIYKVAEHGIVNLAFGLDATGQPNWILKSISTDHNLCYQRWVGNLEQVRVKGNASFILL